MTVLANQDSAALTRAKKFQHNTTLSAARAKRHDVHLACNRGDEKNLCLFTITRSTCPEENMSSYFEEFVCEDILRKTAQIFATVRKEKCFGVYMTIYDIEMIDKQLLVEIIYKQGRQFEQSKQILERLLEWAEVENDCFLTIYNFCEKNWVLLVDAMTDNSAILYSYVD